MGGGSQDEEEKFNNMHESILFAVGNSQSHLLKLIEDNREELSKKLDSDREFFQRGMSDIKELLSRQESQRAAQPKGAAGAIGVGRGCAAVCWNHMQVDRLGFVVYF